MFQQIRLLVFDLDYLVFDCANLKVQALRQSLVAFADDIPQNVPLPDEVDIESAFLEYGPGWIRSLDLGIRDAQMGDLERSYKANEKRLLVSGRGRMYPGVVDMLRACRDTGIQSALGAEASRDYLMAVSDRHELDRLFDIALCTEEYGLGSAREMLSDMLDQAEVNPSEVLVHGTRPFFFEASHNLDLLTVGCGWGLHHKDALESADFLASDVTQVIPIIRRADDIASQYAG